MKIGQRGTARNGQTGTIAEVYTNAVLFQSDTGAKFTPDGQINSGVAQHLFAKITAGFYFVVTKQKGRIVNAQIRAIPHGYVTPTKSAYCGDFLAWYDRQQRVSA